MKYQNFRDITRCPNCGNVVDIEISFCEKCGIDLLEKGVNNKSTRDKTNNRKNKRNNGRPS
jgi:rRNA maturation endonuclease Nob1